MKIKVCAQELLEIEAQVSIVGLFEDAPLEGAAAGLDEALGGQISRLIEGKEFKGKLMETLVLYPGAVKAGKVVLVGLGKAKEFDAERGRQAAGQAYKAAATGRVESIASVVPGSCGQGSQAVAEGLLLAAYRYEAKGLEKEPQSVKEIILAAGENAQAVEKAVKRAEATVAATNLARTLVNTPANHMTPSHMAAIARQTAEANNLACQILEREQMEELGMGSLLGVAQGSAQPPKLIVLRHEGNPGGETLALVGKGITFDSGGISLKQSTGMEMMKNDMAGGAAVLAAMGAIGALKPKVNVLGVIACTENLPSGTALKPGDVIEAMTGQTIEIISTDAEGRLVLADAVAYAEAQGASRIVDVATLTGAIGVALGNIYAGLISSDDDLSERVLTAAAKSGERFWRMPVHDDYRELYKSDVATMKNGGARGGGAITGGMIIGEFVKDAAWAHLDIAAMASSDKDKGYAVKGATGFATRTLIQIAEDLAQ